MGMGRQASTLLTLLGMQMQCAMQAIVSCESYASRLIMYVPPCRNSKSFSRGATNEARHYGDHKSTIVKSGQACGGEQAPTLTVGLDESFVPAEQLHSTVCRMSHRPAGLRSSAVAEIPICRLSHRGAGLPAVTLMTQRTQDCQDCSVATE